MQNLLAIKTAFINIAHCKGQTALVPLIVILTSNVLLEFVTVLIDRIIS
jgi:hypothetical protein